MFCLERVTACNDALIQADKVLRKMKDTLANDQQDGTVNQSVEQTSWITYTCISH